MQKKTYNTSVLLKATDEADQDFIQSIRGKYELHVRPLREKLQAQVLEQCFGASEFGRFEELYAKLEASSSTKDVENATLFLNAEIDAQTFLIGIGKKPTKKMSEGAVMTRACYTAARIIRDSKTV